MILALDDVPFLNIQNAEDTLFLIVELAYPGFDFLHIESDLESNALTFTALLS